MYTAHETHPAKPQVNPTCTRMPVPHPNQRRGPTLQEGVVRHRCAAAAAAGVGLLLPDLAIHQLLVLGLQRHQADNSMGQHDLPETKKLVGEACYFTQMRCPSLHVPRKDTRHVPSMQHSTTPCSSFCMRSAAVGSL